MRGVQEVVGGTAGGLGEEVTDGLDHPYGGQGKNGAANSRNGEGPHFSSPTSSALQFRMSPFFPLLRLRWGFGLHPQLEIPLVAVAS